MAVTRRPPPKKAPPKRASTGKVGGIRPEGSSDIKHDVSKVEATLYCYERRIAGESYVSISERSEGVLGVHLGVNAIHKIIDTFIETTVMPTVEVYRAVELDRLDGYLLKLEDRINLGDDKAITLALKISERRAKLVGMDAPVAIRATIESTPMPAGVEELVSVARDKAAQRALEAGQLPPDVDEGDDDALGDDEVIDAEVVADTRATFLRLLESPVDE